MDANRDRPACKMSEAQQAAIPVEREWWRPSLTITLHALETAAQRDGLRVASGGHRGLALAGLAIPDPEREACHLFVDLPAAPTDYEYQAVGHELMHCFAGAYHPDLMTGKTTSNAFTPEQAAAQRRGYESAIAEADGRSRWTLACTLGLAGCPAPPRSPYPPTRITLHPATADQVARLTQTLAPGASEGLAVADRRAGRCDLYLEVPTTYLGHGMEVLGRRAMDCFQSPPLAPAEMERRRQAVRSVMDATP